MSMSIAQKKRMSIHPESLGYPFASDGTGRRFSPKKDAPEQKEQLRNGAPPPP